MNFRCGGVGVAQFQGGMELCGLWEVCWFTGCVSVLWCGVCKCSVVWLLLVVTTCSNTPQWWSGGKSGATRQ